MSKGQKKFNTFSGVFTPTILTILGVILYLRLGWVVGSVGLTKTLIIILIAHVATITTGLSLASMATNVKVGAGGFYAFISRSLGPEIGGSVGIPLYLSQTLSIALYIIGFTEVWVTLFPDHSARAVSAIVLLVLLLLTYIGAHKAMKIQFLIIGLIIFSLVSFFSSDMSFSQSISISPDMIQIPESGKFWMVFAVFFPAVTGIGAGVAMSGDLKNPRRNLPIGILTAVACGLVIYIVTAVWLAGMADRGELTANYMIMSDKARWGWAILLGIMGATISSALGSFMGAPRILYALSSDRIILFSRPLSVMKKGEPRNAILLTGVIVFITLQLGELNAVASLLTMFFLISYSAINLTVLIEKAINLPSYRPSFNVPSAVPFIGFIWCIVIMFLINKLFAGISLGLLVFLYVYYARRDLDVPFSDTRSGIFNAIAEWAAKRSMEFPSHKKSWKPNILIPVENPVNWNTHLDFIRDIVYPSGSLRLISVNILKKGMEKDLLGIINHVFRRRAPEVETRHDEYHESTRTNLDGLENTLKERGIFVRTTVVDAVDFIEGISIIIQTLRGMFFPPNIALFTLSNDSAKIQRLQNLIAISVRDKLGIIIVSLQPEFHFGKKKTVNVWLRTGTPNKNLAILIALQLSMNWQASINLLTVINDESEHAKAHRELKAIIDRGRLKPETRIIIKQMGFFDALSEAPEADLHIFGISADFNSDRMREIRDKLERSCLFIMDSGAESIFV